MAPGEKVAGPKRGKYLQVVGFHLKILTMHLHEGHISNTYLKVVAASSNLPVEALLDVFAVRRVLHTRHPMHTTAQPTHIAASFAHSLSIPYHLNSKHGRREGAASCGARGSDAPTSGSPLVSR